MTVLDLTRTRRSDDRLEGAIRESAEANSILAMFDASSVGLGFVDCDFRIIRINEVLASMTGMSAACPNRRRPSAVPAHGHQSGETGFGARGRHSTIASSLID